MLCPETRTYAALPPSDCGRRNCTQKRHTRMASAIPAALFVRAHSRLSRLGGCTSARCALLLIVDHELRLIRGGCVIGRAERRRDVRRAAGLADPPAEVRAAVLD